ncbi:acyl carrier protein [Alkalibacter mobilis]|uniref:acyl carrier protein n=1 Tax=Alkalibacter mobilis TaxID=2787712 RepID=UPI00189C818F|nr:acyl carrier protein [Alkalibacter mobilis]MBF7095838.1 acyl carrier protein [Alkalibacter mobilis]
MSTFDKIKNIILEHLDIQEDDITLNADFMEDLGADSLDVAELIMSIEDEFNLEINEEEIEGMRTVEDVVEYLDKL